MNLNTFLLPPITIPEDRLLRQLMLFFDEIFLYAASEDGCDDNLYTQNHLLKHYAPLPFAEDLEKFQNLIKDIKKNRAEYYSGGLFSMSAAANHLDENAVWQLVTDILSPESKDDKHAKIMLEARLILRLAEIATSEEEEISIELDKANLLAESLLDELKNKETHTTNTPRLSSAVAMNIPKLIRAWAYLFLSDKEVKQPWIVTTASLDVFEMLADYYSVNLNEQPEKICSMTLPEFSMNDTASEYLDKRDEFRKSSVADDGCRNAVLDDFENLLKQASWEGVDRLALKKVETSWQEMAAPLNEDANYQKVNFYLFQGVSLPEIFSRVTKGNQPYHGKDFPPNGVVAVIS